MAANNKTPISKVERPKNPVGRPVGLPKTGGRVAGTPNKKSLIFRERLEAAGCDIHQVLAEALLTKDHETVASIASLLPYLAPRLKEVIETKDDSAPDVSPDLSTAELVAIARGKQ